MDMHQHAHGSQSEHQHGSGMAAVDDCAPKPEPGSPPEGNPTFGGHGQLIVGTGPIYLSHLPMFMFNPMRHPHNFQVILEVTFTGSNGDDPEETYVRDRVHTLTRLYTLAPDPFVMLDLVTPDPEHPLRRCFKGQIFREHFERPNEVHPEAPRHLLLGEATVNVQHVVYFQEFDPNAAHLPLLEYLLFGKGDELFLAHHITRPPDFDQMLSVQITNHQFTDDELRNAITITIPGRRNDLGHRLQEGEKVTGQAQIKGANGPEVIDLDLEIGKEFYLESGELSEPM